MLRWTLLIGSALVFIIPFIIADNGVGFQNPNLYIPFWGMFFPFITGKNFAFRILIEILLGVYVLLALREPKYRPNASVLAWAFTLFVAWMGIATLASVDPVKSLWSNFERMEGYLMVLHLFVYFFIVSTVVTVEKWWDRLFQFSITSGALMGIYAMLQLAGVFPISTQSGSRVDGTFGNATYLAVFMLFNIFLTLFMLVRQRNSTTAQALYGIALVLQLATLYFTETRGALLGVVGGFVVAALYTVWKAHGTEWKVLRRTAQVTLGVIAVLVIAFFSLRTTPLLKEAPSALGRLASISFEDTTTSARLFYIWPMALDGFAESPKTMAVGWGQENFNYVFNAHYSPQMYNQEQWFDRAHNQFLDWLIAGGLPAFLLYVSFFILAALYIMRSKLEAPEQAMLLGLLAAYAFNNLFVFQDIMSAIYFVLLLAFVHSLTTQHPRRWMFLTRPVGEHGIAIAAPIVAVAVVTLVWTVNAPAIARAQNLLVALTPQVLVAGPNGAVAPQPKDPKQRLAEFQTALGDGVWPGTALGYQETVEQFLQYSSSIAASTSIDPAVKQNTFATAQNAVVALMQQRPNDARLELFSGAFLNGVGQYQQALDMLNKALSHSPKKQQIMFEIGVAHLNAKQTAEAVAILKSAFEEAPGYTDARIFYASGLYYAGQAAEADALLTDGFGTVVVNDPRLLQVLVNIKRYDRVIEIWKMRVQQNPNDAQQHVGLAAAYFTTGDKTNAIAELQRAAQLNPSLAAQIQAVIAGIKDGTIKPQ